MKKSELKSLIKEVIKEALFDNPIDTENESDYNVLKVYCRTQDQFYNVIEKLKIFGIKQHCSFIDISYPEMLLMFGHGNDLKKNQDYLKKMGIYSEKSFNEGVNEENIGDVEPITTGVFQGNELKEEGLNNSLTIDSLISQLQQIKSKQGGDFPVAIKLADYYEGETRLATQAKVGEEYDNGDWIPAVTFE